MCAWPFDHLANCPLGLLAGEPLACLFAPLGHVAAWPLACEAWPIRQLIFLLLCRLALLPVGHLIACSINRVYSWLLGCLAVFYLNPLLIGLLAIKILNCLAVCPLGRLIALHLAA